MKRHKTLKLAMVALTVMTLVLANVLMVSADPLTLGLSVNPTGKVKNPLGVVTLTGTVTCDVSPVSVFISGQLTQPVGRKTLLVGFFSTSTVCSGGTGSWSATLTAQNGRFGGGSAHVNAFASGCTFYYGGCASASVSASIKLKGGK